MRNRASRAMMAMLFTVLTMAPGVSAEEEEGGPGGYANWGPFYPYSCTVSNHKCRYYSDASTPSSPTYTGCGILDRWQNGIDVMWRCTPQ